MSRRSEAHTRTHPPLPPLSCPAHIMHTESKFMGRTFKGTGRTVGRPEHRLFHMPVDFKDYGRERLCVIIAHTSAYAYAEAYRRIPCAVCLCASPGCHKILHSHAPPAPLCLGGNGGFMLVVFGGRRGRRLSVSPLIPTGIPT